MKPSEKRILRKREQILFSAISIINQRGYDGATMEDIAADLLMTKSSLYYYFKSKGDLMYQCHNFVLSQAVTDLEHDLNADGTAEEVLRGMISTHMDYVLDEKETNNLIIEPHSYFNEEQLEPVLKLRKHYSSLFDKVIEKGISTGEFTVDKPLVVRMIILGSTNWTQQWFSPNGKMTKEELKQDFGDYFLKLLK